MTKRSRARHRDRIEDKAILDHLTSGPLKPEMPAKGHDGHRRSEPEGRKLEKAIHKDWTPDKGGLQGF